jgi:hypothetical protein
LQLVPRVPVQTQVELFPLAQTRLSIACVRDDQGRSRDLDRRVALVYVRVPQRPASRPLNTSKMMQPSSATAQSFQEPNHSKSRVPCTSQTMNQIKLAMFSLLRFLLSAATARAEGHRAGRRQAL